MKTSETGTGMEVASGQVGRNVVTGTEITLHARKSESKFTSGAVINNKRKQGKSKSESK